jgi:hypothetical protein
VKVLTLTQPWATLVGLGEKRIETRDWRTAYRGPLAIHAAKGFPVWAKELTLYDPMFVSVLGARAVMRLPRGAVVAVCRLVDVRPTEQLEPTLSRKERAFGDFTAGRWGWVLDDVLALPEPIAASGSLGLWEWNDPDAFRWLSEQGWPNPQGGTNGGIG